MFFLSQFNVNIQWKLYGFLFSAAHCLPLRPTQLAAVFCIQSPCPTAASTPARPQMALSSAARSRFHLRRPPAGMPPLPADWVRIAAAAQLSPAITSRFRASLMPRAMLVACSCWLTAARWKARRAERSACTSASTARAAAAAAAVGSPAAGEVGALKQ